MGMPHLIVMHKNIASLKDKRVGQWGCPEINTMSLCCFFLHGIVELLNQSHHLKKELSSCGRLRM